MNSLVKPYKQSFLPRIKVRGKLQQESRKTKENTGFPPACPVGRLKDCGNDRKSNVLLLMVFLVISYDIKKFFTKIIKCGILLVLRQAEQAGES